MTTTDSKHWGQPQPARLPRPSYAPAAFALGNALLLWGLLTTWVIAAVGALLSGASLLRWLRDLVREHDEAEP